MTVHRATTSLLRSTTTTTASRIGSRTAPVIAPLRNHQQTRTKIRGPDDLNGPGGQEPPPQRPAGGDTVQRNWVPIAAGALAVVAGFAYMTSGRKPAGKGNIEAKAEEGMEVARKRAHDATRKGEEGLRKLEDKSAPAVGELAGRKGALGGFRSE